jgi:hypothetical protein
MADIHNAPIIVNRGNQSVLVAADVKHGEFADVVG